MGQHDFQENIRREYAIGSIGPTGAHLKMFDK